MPKQTRTNRQSASRAGRPIAKSALTRRRILDAAAWALLNFGYAATRLEDIAEHAGLQAGSLYYYFDSKDELVEEVLRYGVQFNHAHVRAAADDVPAEATAGERLDVAVSAYLEGMLELGDLGPAHVRTFPQVPPAMQERLRPLRQAFGKFWAGLIDDAIAEGAIRADLHPYVVRLFITQALERVAEWHLPRPLAAAELSQIMRSIIWEGVAARTPARDGQGVISSQVTVDSVDAAIRTSAKSTAGKSGSAESVAAEPILKKSASAKSSNSDGISSPRKRRPVPAEKA